MDLYQNYYDKEIKDKEDNYTIGLILVSENNKVVTKYSSIYQDNNIFVSLYKTILPSNEELNKIINEEKIIYLGSKIK